MELTVKKIITDFLDRMAHTNAPAFLLLGQSYLRHGASSDAFLNTILTKYGNGKTYPGESYREIFDTNVKNDIEAGRTWISERANSLVTPNWLASTAEYAWSGVYTSSIDGLISRTFRADWRSIQPLFSPHFQPLDPRNRSKLHITYLYGSLERDEERQRAPLNQFDLILKEPDATALLQRLPEQLTPMGTLVIEAYNGDSDWLAMEKLYPVLMALEKGQAYIFSTSAAKIVNPYFESAISEGKLIVVEQSLATTMLYGREAGVLPPIEKFVTNTKGHHLAYEEKTVEVPEQVWAQISRYATIIDDSLLSHATSLSAEKRYAAFRSFLAESGVQPIWSAYALGLPFERDFEKNIFDQVKIRLQTRAFDSEPIIVHGQTGSGKTIALASVALRTRENSINPVIFIARRSQRFNHADIDNFCLWAESVGFPATLIIWDGMQDVEQYYLLHKYLVGRGRKVVLVGSTYKLDDETVPSQDVINAPVHITNAEIPRFKKYLSSFEPTLDAALDQFLQKGDASFLVALYRLLPETRSQVKRGLHLEAGAAEISIRARSEATKPVIEQTVLGQALSKAGLLDTRTILPSGNSLMGGEWVSAEQELIGLVMVPSRFGLQVPIEILLRSVSATAVTNFHAVISGIDLFRWSEDSLNNVAIGARHALEARLIAQSRLGGPQAEIEYAAKLLLNVRRSEGDATEIQFASELVRSLGSNGPEGKLYLNQYLQLANTLTELRETKGVKVPRLMLQEASLLREAIVLNLIGEGDLPLRLETLERAKQVLLDAISSMGSSPKIARLKSMLLVELASTHGAITREYMRADSPVDQIMFEFSASRLAAMKARTLIPEDFFPIDVIAWSTKDLLTHASLNEQTRLEVVVNLFNTFSMCEGDEISPRDKEKLDRRRLEFANLLGDDVLKQESLTALERSGSTAGYYLQAINIAGELPIATGIVTPERIERCKRASDYLRENFDSIKEDGKCVYLYLRYWWTASAGKAFYPPERTTIALNTMQWGEALQILESLLSLEEEFTNPTLMYLQAISKWQLGYYDDSASIWRELQQISDRVTGRRRVLKTYLASNSDGEPRVFNGTVANISDDGSKGEIFVEGIRQRIAFFPRDFGLDDIRRDEHVSGFHIAFNYIAPTADPVRHHVLSRKG